jgi:molybdenum cofactor cytidylyltransferase
MESAAIVPAAGHSRRMGQPKWSLPYGEDIVLGAVIGALRGGGVGRIALVIRPDDERLASWAADQPIMAAINRYPSRGMLSSILVGLEALGGATSWPARGAALLVCPGDLPALRSETVWRLLETAASEKKALIVPSYQGQRGHPLVIAPSLVPEISTLERDVGLRQLLIRYPDEVRELAVDDPGCVRDVDTAAQYRRLRPHSA